MMADHGFYLAMSYGVAALAIAAELVALRIGRASALKQVDEERDLEAQD